MYLKIHWMMMVEAMSEGKGHFSALEGNGVWLIIV